MRLKSERFLVVERQPELLMALAGSVRRRTEAALDRFDSRRPGSALARAVILGDRSRLPKELRQALARSGLSHLLAVSGLHVGLLALLLWLPGRLLPARLRYLPALAGIGVYLMLVGPRPSILRASIMALLALTALMIDRPPQGLNALACCAALLALIDPAVTSELGFRLSVAATAGILVLAPIFTERWTALPSIVRGPLAVTVAAQLATLPWALPLEGGVHPLAPVLNLIAIPCLALFLAFAFAWLALALISDFAATWAVSLLDALAVPFEALGELPPGPIWFLPVTVAPWTVPVLSLVVVGAALWPVRAARCALLSGLLVLTGAGSPRTAVPELLLLDVGQGDAVLLRDGSRAVLIDGGGWPHGDLGGRVLVPALSAQGVRRLDAIVLTHPDLDHCNGLLDVARYLPVTEVWMGPGWLEAGCAADLVALRAARWRVLWRGETRKVGRWRFETLYPDAGLRRGRNDRSLVLAAVTSEHRVLLTGDVEGPAERRLARRLGPGLAADVLKVAHHGSRPSTSAAFLAAVRPRLALVSAAPGNPHGHPHPTVTGRLRSSGIRVLRTDLSGMVRLRFHPKGRIAIFLPGSPRASRAERRR